LDLVDSNTITLRSNTIMEKLLSQIEIKVNDHIYVKDPLSSDLGKRIVSGGIDFIYEHGIETFTFKKLGQLIGSPEASIYRYFENKHKFLLYLTSWYWSWLEYQLVFATANIQEPQIRLERALDILTQKYHRSQDVFDHINEAKLQEIVMCESSKAYHTRHVDEENQEGVFSSYKRLVGRVSDMITDVNPHYPYPHMIISTVIEGVHNQRYFAAHLPRLTDVHNGKDPIRSFFMDMVMKSIST